MGNSDRLYFSQRSKLEKIINEWTLANEYSNCPLNTISFLQQHDLIDINKVRDFIEKKSDEIKNPCPKCGDEWDSLKLDSCQNCGNAVPF